MAKSVINKINSGSVEYNIASTAYCTCATAAGTAAKVAYVQGDSTSATTGFTLAQGVTVHVKFTYSNTAASPTLSINGSTAKSIMRYGTTAVSTSAATSWRAGAIVAFTYDGTNWVMNTGIDDNSGDITGVTAGNGLTGGATSGTATLNVGAGTGITVAADSVSAKLRSETALTIDSAAATTTSGRVYPVAVDKSGYLAVNVPWTNSTNFASASHTHDYSGTTGNNSGTAVAAVTAINAGSGSLTNTESSGIQYTEDISGSAPSLGGTKTFVTGYSSFSGGGATEKYLHHSHTAASLGTASTSSAAPGKHTHSYTTYSLSGSNCSHSTRKMSFSAGTTPVSSISVHGGEGCTEVLVGSFSEGVLEIQSVTHAHSVEITRGTAPSMNFNASSGNTYVYSVTNSNLSLSTASGNTGENSGTNFNAVTGYPNFSGGSGSLTSNTTASGGIKYLSDHTAASLGTASTGTVSISGGSYSATKKYLTHTHTGASVKSTANAAPHTHTHDYSGTTGAPK